MRVVAPEIFLFQLYSEGSHQGAFIVGTLDDNYDQFTISNLNYLKDDSTGMSNFAAGGIDITEKPRNDGQASFVAIFKENQPELSKNISFTYG